MKLTRYPRQQAQETAVGQFCGVGRMHGEADGGRPRSSYISKLTLEATKDKKTEESEMIKSLDRMVKVIGIIIIIPVGAVLLIQEWFVLEGGFRSSVISMVAAVLGDDT